MEIKYGKRYVKLFFIPLNTFYNSFVCSGPNISGLVWLGLVCRWGFIWFVVGLFILFFFWFGLGLAWCVLV